MLCNVCPAVVFDDDLTAIAQLGNISQSLNWEPLGNLIILTNQLKGGKSYYIESGDYTWKMENKGKFPELYLKPAKGLGG